MRFRALALFAFVAVAIPTLPVRAAEKALAAPTIVVRLASLDGLIADICYLAEVVGKGEEAKQAAGLFKQFSGGKGLDTTKPIGLYGRLAAKIEESDFALMLPVTDEKEFLALLEGANVKFEKEKGDVYKVDLPNVPLPGYFRFANGYVYGTVRNAKLLDNERLLAPAAVLPLGRTGMLEVVADLDQIPAAFKEVIVGQVALRLAEQKGEKKANETEEQFKFRSAVADELANQIRAVIDDGKEVTLRLDIDRKNADLVTTLHFTARPGSKLAESVAALGRAKSVVANLSDTGSALSGRAFVEMPLALRKSFEAVVDAEMKKAMGNAPDETARDLMAKVFKAIRPTLKAAEADVGFDLRGPAANGNYTLLVGAAVKEGEEIEKAVRAVYAVLPPDAREAITLDAEKSKSGVNIHRIAVPPAVIDPNFKRLFGAGPVYFVTRKDVVLLAAGDNALVDLRDIMEREPKVGKMVQVDMSVARVVALDTKPDAIAVAKKVFAADKDLDRLRLTLEGGKSLELRLSAKAKLLEFAVRLDEERKKGEK